MKHKKGFTLLEMLIVLGIAALLLAALTTSYSTAQKKSRDAKRKSDLKVFQNAYEQYYSVCGFAYPTSAAGGATADAAPVICPNPSTAIMPTVPLDPRTNAAYKYTSNGSSYSICVNPTQPVIETQPSLSSYCTTNQQ